MTTKTDEQEREAFDAWAGQFDQYSSEYQDMGADEYFIAGYRAALQSQDREDATRIDWMARQDLDDLCFSIIRDAPHDGEYCVDAGRGPVFGGTFREAIDHARRIEKERT